MKKESKRDRETKKKRLRGNESDKMRNKEKDTTRETNLIGEVFPPTERDQTQAERKSPHQLDRSVHIRLMRAAEGKKRGREWRKGVVTIEEGEGKKEGGENKGREGRGRRGKMG